MNIRNAITMNYEIFFRLFGDKTNPNKPKVAKNQSSFYPQGIIDNQLRRQTQCSFCVKIDKMTAFFPLKPLWSQVKIENLEAGLCLPFRYQGLIIQCFEQLNPEHSQIRRKR